MLRSKEINISSSYDEQPSEKHKYSHQYLLICGSDTLPGEFEKFIYNSYRHKWAKNHHDPFCCRLHTILINDNDHIEDEKFSSLAFADHHSRITIVGHYDVGTDFIFYGNTKIDYRKIVDLIRHHVTSETILLKNQNDITARERALRITFVACNIGVNLSNKKSLAERMFNYACNHSVKPLRIEMTAPNMFCAPVFGDKKNRVSPLRFFCSTSNSSTAILHKRYCTLPYYNGNFFFFENSAGLLSMLFPRYRPYNYKSILKIDTVLSTPEKITPNILSPEQEIAHQRLSSYLSTAKY